MFKSTIEKATIKFKAKFDYSKAIGTKVTDKVTITCPIHGDFTQELRVHLRSTEGCRKCAKEKANIASRKTQEQFITEATKKHANKYDYTKVVYINDLTKITIVCPIHGEFEQVPSSHLQGCGCKKCAKITQSTQQKTPTEKLQNMFNLPVNITVDLHSYVNSKTKMKCNCEFHGPFLQLPEILINGKGVCPICAKQLRGWNRSLYKNSPTMLYLLELPNNLYKVGITKSCDIKTRYSKLDRAKIQDILFQVTIFDGILAWDIEKEVLRKCKNNRYIGPSIFSDTGNTEIFTINPIHIIKDILNERLL